jgi:hypothetical protein
MERGLKMNMRKDDFNVLHRRQAWKTDEKGRKMLKASHNYENS